MEYTKFSENLRNLIDEKAYTLQDVSDATGLAPSTISKYLNGHIIPKARSLKALAKFFDVSPSQLMGEDDQDTNTSLLIKQLISHTRNGDLDWEIVKRKDGIEEFEAFYNNYCYSIKRGEEENEVGVLTVFSWAIEAYNLEPVREKIFQKGVYEGIEIKALKELFDIVSLNILTDEDKILINVLEDLKTSRK